MPPSIPLSAIKALIRGNTKEAIRSRLGGSDPVKISGPLARKMQREARLSDPTNVPEDYQDPMDALLALRSIVRASDQALRSRRGPGGSKLPLLRPGKPLGLDIMDPMASEEYGQLGSFNSMGNKLFLKLNKSRAIEISNRMNGARIPQTSAPSATISTLLHELGHYRSSATKAKRNKSVMDIAMERYHDPKKLQNEEDRADKWAAAFLRDKKARENLRASLMMESTGSPSVDSFLGDLADALAPKNLSQTTAGSLSLNRGTNPSMRPTYQKSHLKALREYGPLALAASTYIGFKTPGGDHTQNG